MCKFAREKQNFMLNLRFVIAAGIAACLTASCGGGSTSSTGKKNDEALTKSVEKSTAYSDLKMFELTGPVKECVSETFYKCEYNGDKVEPDTSAINRRNTQISFDRNGKYMAAKDEEVKRDEKGRMTYWRDARPNDAKVHPGVLRDTLEYKHLNNNVLQTTGMGEYAVTVYDNQNRVVGMYSQNATVENALISAFNVYRKEDRQGNWTERLTIWTSRGANGKPHITYSLTRRTITYY